MKMKLFYTFLLLSFLIHQFSYAQHAPKRYGVVPSARQLQWQEMEMYALIHYTPTTFQNKEWGFGDADPAIFNPSAFDADKIVAAIKSGGFKGITMVAKHHDGFCLWPTKTTSYNISQSPFRSGEGDLVKEMELAVRKAGLSFGIYCSPWDRNNAYYGQPEYITNVYYPQLKELYSNYGDLYTVFFDGANGGDGYYGGTNEKRKIDASAYYNFDSIWSIVRNKQPRAAIFSDIGPDIRWVGNENGIAASTSWATFTPQSPQEDKKPAPGFVVGKDLPGGTRNGKYWIPAECDVPLRPGWFYHPDQDDKVKSPQALIDLYYQSVGRGASLDLGIAPMPNGLLHENDIKSLQAFGDYLHKTFAVNYAKSATAKASNTRANSAAFSAKNLVDEDRYSYWATDDKEHLANVTFSLAKPATFNVIRIRENIKLGQRIEELEVDIWRNNKWETIANATSIGGNRLIRLPSYITASKVRLRITQSPVCIALSDFGLYKEPIEYLAKTSPIATVKKENTTKDWRVMPGDAKAAIDGDESTVYTLAGTSHPEIKIGMGKNMRIKSFTYLPCRQNCKVVPVTHYSLYTSISGSDWRKVSDGEFANILNNPVLQTVYLPENIQARYIRFVAEKTAEGQLAGIAEIDLQAANPD